MKDRSGQASHNGNLVLVKNIELQEVCMPSCERRFGLCDPMGSIDHSPGDAADAVGIVVSTSRRLDHCEGFAYTKACSDTRMRATLPELCWSRKCGVESMKPELGPSSTDNDCVISKVDEWKSLREDDMRLRHP